MMQTLEKYKLPLMLALNAVLVVAVLVLAFSRRSAPAGSEAMRTDARDDKGESPYHKHEVKNTIVKNMAAIAECYNQFTAGNPGKKDGVIKIDWQILPDGRVKNPQVVTNELAQEKGGSALGECSTKAISGWSFPEPPTERPVYVWHNFYFGKPVPRGAPQMVNSR
jgi:hypothetical protein